MELALAIMWCVFIILATAAVVLGLQHVSREDYETYSTGLTAAPKIFGVLSYIDKPDYVYVVDMTGGHEYKYADKKLSLTGNKKFLGTMVPLNMLDKIDAISVDPTPGSFMHLIFSNADKIVYVYNPISQKIEHSTSYKDAFGGDITRVAAAWQTPFTGPDFEYLFVYDGTDVWRVNYADQFNDRLDKSVRDGRFDIINSVYGGSIVGATPIWSKNPATDVHRPIGIFGNKTYTILRTLTRKASAELPYKNPEL